MAGFHLPDDSYFPDQENGGELNVALEAEPQLPLDNDLARDLPENLDPKPEDGNLPQEAQIPIRTEFTILILLIGETMKPYYKH